MFNINLLALTDTCLLSRAAQSKAMIHPVHVPEHAEHAPDTLPPPHK
jgi:hypothetical protein